MRAITIQEAHDCIKRTLPQSPSDMWVLVNFMDFVNNNTYVEDMEEQEFFESFLPCALWAFTESVLNQMVPMIKDPDDFKEVDYAELVNCN